MPDDFNKKYPHLNKHRAALVKNALAMQKARKLVKELSGDNDWDLIQQLLQEIIASHTIANPDVLPKVPQLIKELELEIGKRYEKEPDLMVILLEGIPTPPSVRNWTKKEGWVDAIWKQIQGTGLFTHSKRSEMIEALRSRGLARDTQAAKIWLTLSGDYSDKMDVKDDRTVDLFREINNKIHQKKE